jgi:membrane protein implicated in regulation of membrane protease activity
MVLEYILSDIPLLLLFVGAGLVIAEAFAPGAHFFVVGVSLLAAGAVGLILPASLGATLSFGIMAIVVILTAMATLYGYKQLDLIGGGSGQGRTSDSDSLRGKTGRVTKRVTPTDGEVKLSQGGFNPNYKARTIDGEIEEGEEVLVVDPGGGNVLTVESFANVEDEIDRELERDRRATEAESETESSS